MLLALIVTPAFPEENPKSEARNPKQIRRTEIQMTETLPPLETPVWNVGF
jgi:hypothetical protein